MDVRPPNLLGADRAALAELLESWNERSFHARQMMRWIHARGVTDYEEMSDLSLRLRQRLAEHTQCQAPEIVSVSQATDDTRKFLFDVGGAAIETVWIPSARRKTLCVSSQAGCSLGCTFCLTGKQGFAKNLDSWQILGQVQAVNAAVGEAGRATNVVFMGMGEPLLNLKQVVPALRALIDPLGYGLSRRRVTVSTAGVVPGIDRLRELAPVALAVSLHAPDDELRNELVPINRRYPIAELLGACQRYLSAAPRDFITFEYALLADVNDSVSQARDLARLLSEIPAKINLIPFNPFDQAPYKAPSRNRIMAFRDALNERGLIATVRQQRGNDILAACGQLAGTVSGTKPSGGRISQVMMPT